MSSMCNARAFETSARAAGWIVAIVLGFSGSALGHAAGLVKVEQMISGRDCSDCASEVAANLERMDGVRDASIDVSTGRAQIDLEKGSSVTLGQIRQELREQGFTPEYALVRASGMMSRSNAGAPGLMMAHDQRYRLEEATGSPAAWALIERYSEGASVELQGRVPADDTGRLLVTEVVP